MRKPPVSPYRHWAERDTVWIGKGASGLWATIVVVAALAGTLAWIVH